MLLVNLFFFMTMAFPKAGILLSGVSITIAEILFIVALVKSKKELLIFFSDNKVWFYLYIFYSMTIIFSTLINIKQAPAFRIAVSVVLMISPLAIGIGCNLDQKKAAKILEISLIIVGIYALLQWLVGIEKTAIQGITIAYGDSFRNKTIGIGVNGLEAMKMPSTYQVGNGAGLFYILAITTMLNIKYENNKIKMVSIILGIIGILLSGSRSCIIPFILFLPIVLEKVYTKLSKNMKLFMILTLILFLTCGSIYVTKSNSKFIKYFYERNIKTTLTDSTAAGRTVILKESIEFIKNKSFFEKLKIFFVGAEWNAPVTSEGVLYVFLKYGIIALICFILLLLLPIFRLYKNYRIVSIGLLGVFIAFCVDSAFNSPPSLMNYFIIVGIFWKKQEQQLYKEGMIKNESSNNNFRFLTSSSK